MENGTYRTLLYTSPKQLSPNTQHFCARATRTPRVSYCQCLNTAANKEFFASPISSEGCPHTCTSDV
eukprot:2010501-Amphidinium_carterae.1